MTDTTTLADGTPLNSGVSFTVVMHLFRNRHLSERGYHWAHSARMTLCVPAAAHMCPPARCEHGVFLDGVPLRNTRFAEADLRGASTSREVAHRLAFPPRGHGVTAVPRPAPLTEQGAPQDPRQDLTSGGGGIGTET